MTTAFILLVLSNLISLFVVYLNGKQFAPNEIRSESILKSTDKQAMVFLDTIFCIIHNGIKNIDAIQLKLFECGYYINIQNLEEILDNLCEKKIIDIPEYKIKPQRLMQ
jgi:hypothetical protein